jgi:hypothetical protein
MHDWRKFCPRQSPRDRLHFACPKGWGVWLDWHCFHAPDQPEWELGLKHPAIGIRDLPVVNTRRDNRPSLIYQ